MSTGAIARRFFDEVFSEGKLDLVDELFATDYVGHPSESEEATRGPEGVKEYVAGLRGAASDLTVTVEDQVAEGDKVVTRWMAQGTHDGELMGIAPTGRTAVVAGITIQRLRDGKVVEGWTNWDLMGMLRQLGVAPGAPQG
ncbi:MAG: ester cyclase [Actinomycetota bacterium]